MRPSALAVLAVACVAALAIALRGGTPKAPRLEGSRRASAPLQAGDIDLASAPERPPARERREAPAQDAPDDPPARKSPAATVPAATPSPFDLPDPDPGPRVELTGTVVDESGAPVEFIRVTYEWERSWGATMSDAEGRFRIAAHPGTRLTIRAEPERLGLGTAEMEALVPGAPVVLVLPKEPVLVVRLGLPEGVIPKEVRLFLLDAADRKIIESTASESELRMTWPPEAVSIRCAPTERVQPARLPLPTRPTEGGVVIDFGVASKAY